jgi:hypothetical protein
MVQGVSSAAHANGPGQNTVAPLTAIRKRAQKVSNLWLFESPKNGRRLTVSGDVGFLHLVLLEGDPGVDGYDLIDDPFRITSNSPHGYVRLRHRDGTQAWLTFGRQRARGSSEDEPDARDDSLRARATEAGVPLLHRTDVDLHGREHLIDNWLTLCAIMTRARSYPCHIETERFLSCFVRHDSPTVASMLAMHGIDHGVMLAVIAKALQSGRYAADLERQLFGPHTQIKRVRQ